MAKRVFIVHCWQGTPTDFWYPWLKEKLEKNGFEVYVPEMPNTEAPEIDAWVSHLADIVKTLDEETYFVGHSIGCQTIMRYLSDSQNHALSIGGSVFVAPWFNLPNLETDLEKAIAKPWLETPIRTERLDILKGKLVAIFSDDDPHVPLSDSELFQEKLGAKVIIERSKGHYDIESSIEAQSALEELLNISK